MLPLQSVSLLSIQLARQLGIVIFTVLVVCMLFIIKLTSDPLGRLACVG